MKVVVPVKRVVDYHIRVHVKSDGSGVETAGLKMSMNPFDEIAVEAAVSLKEAGIVSEVVVVSAGVAACQDTLRTALAMGGDRAILIEISADAEKNLQPLAVAKLLRAVCDREAPQLVLCGKQAIDDDAHQTGQMLAARLDWPQATAVSAIEAAPGLLTLTREIDGGLERLRVDLPAVVTVDLRLNEPRYVTLPNLMKARKKPIETLTPESLGVDIAPRLHILKVSEPAPRARGEILASVGELVARLKEKGVFA
ncbi:electron transfer flavoprotein subunit beta/FixA family protein [Propionivibrio limicola]|uniref:electron transfer flavoprotein subunit beta/FixA family protein n=1 Tax=Propionivibrio limicola TaxID=167645 RepID=UPI001290FB78|nr:electron transfer flavoprotein subunit beta/FixA family protein [Propionivibrio limicola]